MPRMPRHKLRKFRSEVVKPFCEEHGLTHDSPSFWEANAQARESPAKPREPPTCTGYSMIKQSQIDERAFQASHEPMSDGKHHV